MQEGRPLGYYSRKMTAAERNYVVTEQELLATVEALRVFRCYLLSGKQFNLVTDNRPNTFLQSQPILSRRQARWSEYLQRFHFNWVHRAGRQNVADPLSRNPAFKHLNALLAVSTRRSTGKRSVQDLHPGPAPDLSQDGQKRRNGVPTPAAGKRSVQELHSGPAPDLFQGGQKRRKGVSTPATGANTIPVSRPQHYADANLTHPPINPGVQSADQQSPASDLPDISLIDNFAEAYAADPFFADDAKTADLTFAEGLWWKGDRIVVPDSADTKRLILEAFHDHPMGGHFGCAKTLKAIKSRFYWRYADRDVGDYVRNCPSCQLQTTHPSKPAGLLQPLDVPPYAWHTVTTTSLVCCAHLRATMLLLSLWTSLPSMYMQCLAVTLLMLLTGQTCMLSMLCSMRDFPLSSSLTEALSLTVHSTKP